MKKEKIDYDGLNSVINIGSKILKLFYATLILLLIIGISFLIRDWGIIPFILRLIKVISPFFIGFIIAWLLNPMVNKLNEKGLNRSLSVVLVFLMLIVVLYLFCLAVIPQLVTEVNDVVKLIPDMLIKARELINNMFLKLSHYVNFNMDDIKLQFITYIENFGSEIATDVPTTVISFVQSLVSGVGSFLVGIVIGFYLLFNFNSVSEHLLNIFPKRIRGDAERILTNISKTLYSFVNGTLLVSLILFVISIVGFEIIGLNASVLFAAFCAITNIIPYVGPYIGGIPAVLVGFSQSPLTGLLTLIFIVVVQTIEGNILHPIVMGKKMDLHPITIIISLLIFEHFFGIIGMVVATPIVAILKIIYVFLDEKFDFFGYSKDKSVKKELSKVKLSK